MDGEILNVILQVSLLVFVVSSMLAMGLSLTVSQIIEPLRNARLVVVALVLNFIAVPFIAIGIDAVLSPARTLVCVLSTDLGPRNATCRLLLSRPVRTSRRALRY